MKSLVTYLIENQNFLVNKHSSKSYSYHPQTKEELYWIVLQLIKKNEYNLNCIDTSNITDMSNLFKDINDKTSFQKDKVIDISNWDVSNVTNMSSMFSNCSGFKSFGDLSKWDVSNVTDFRYLFYCSYELEVTGLDKWKVNSDAKIGDAFTLARKLKTPYWAK